MFNVCWTGQSPYVSKETSYDAKESITEKMPIIHEDIFFVISSWELC